VAATNYTPAMVTKALMSLVANSGNVKKTSEELFDDDFQVPIATLRAWKNDVHAEQYRRLEESYGKELEAEAVEVARANIRLAGDKKRALLERIDPEKTPSDQIAQTLKAVTDAEAKGTDGLLKLTGRPTNPHGDQGGASVVELLLKMADRGYIQLAPGLSLDPPKVVPNEAESP
jgi:hypothetical protein